MIETARLDVLRANAEAGQWSPEVEIDWRSSPRVPWWLPRKAYTTLMSQLLHGERASFAMCATLRPLLPAGPARALVDLQERDEARHVAVYERYMARLGDIAAPDDYVERALGGGLRGQGGAIGVMLAYHVVLEGEALVLQQDLAHRLPCPLFARINALAARDEARHVAFGKAHLAGRLAGLPAEERRALFVWLRALWRDCAETLRGRYTGVSRAFFVLSRGSMEQRWARQERALVELGLVTAADAARL
jgi:hypothetical protein